LGQIESQIESTDRPVSDEVKSFTFVPADVSSMPIIGLGSESPTSDFGNYADLKILPDGHHNGDTPSNNPMVIVTTKSERPDLSYYGVNGSVSGYTTENIVRGADSAGGLVSINTSSIRPVIGQNSNPSWASVNSFVEIVNFRSSLGDDRYGEQFSQNNILCTGASVGFDIAPISYEIEVFGGDCYISPLYYPIRSL